MVHHPPLVVYPHTLELFLNDGWTCVSHELYHKTLKCRSFIVVKYANTSTLLKGISPARFEILDMSCHVTALPTLAYRSVTSPTC
jgi:hypothetical protein